jgi:hypothetical protein
VRMINCRAEYSLENSQASLDIDLHLFNSGIPVQNVSFVFTFVDRPYPGSAKATAVVRLAITCPFEVRRPGYHESSDPSDNRAHNLVCLSGAHSLLSRSIQDT